MLPHDWIFDKGLLMESYIYSDGITTIKDPFWDNLCPICGKRFWSVHLDCICPDCGNKDLYILNETNHTAEELAKFNRKRMEDKHENINDYEL